MNAGDDEDQNNDESEGGGDLEPEGEPNESGSETDSEDYSLETDDLDSHPNPEERKVGRIRKTSIKSLQVVNNIILKAQAAGLSQSDLESLLERACAHERYTTAWVKEHHYHSDYVPLYSGEVTNDVTVRQ